MKNIQNAKMSTIFSLVQLLTFYSLISLVRANSNYPLIYSPKASMQYNNEKLGAETITYPAFSACPAEEPEEKELNENHSLSQKALFVRKFYSTDEKLDDTIRCEGNFELTVVRRAATFGEEIEFGFETYYEPKLLPDILEYVGFGRFLERVSRFESITGKYVPEIESPPLTDDRPTKFIWIKKTKLLYDPDSWSATSVKYSLHRSIDRINVQCDDYNLGKIHFKEKDLNSYYSKGNVKTIFNDVEMPKYSKCQSSEDGCIEKYNLLMPHHFQPAPWLSTSCSDLSSVPIWSEVSKDLLNYSEIFLSALSQITENKLTVISGVFETLSLPYKKRGSKEIYLDQANTALPVPRAFYKIVSYQSHNCHNEKDLCWFYVVIVIHNEFEFTKEKKLCPRDKCEEWGLESIQYMNTKAKGEKSKHIYCCRLDPDMETTLEKKMYISRRDDLNLMYFPVYSKDEGDIVNVNKKEEVLELMDKLLPPSN